MDARKETLVQNLFFKPNSKQKLQTWLSSTKNISFITNIFILPECNFMSNCNIIYLEKLTLENNILFFKTSTCGKVIFSVSKTNCEYCIFFSYLTMNLLSNNMEFTFLKGRSIVNLLFQYQEIYDKIESRYEYSRKYNSILFDDFISFIMIPIFSYTQLIEYLSYRNHKIWIIHKLASNWVWKPICSDKKHGIAIKLGWEECQKGSTSRIIT